MTEPTTPILLRLATAAWSFLIAPLWKMFKRPDVPAKKAPANLFEHLRPHTSLAKARDVLGVPTREAANYFSYKFSDAFIQINTDDGKSISAICLVLPKIQRRATFKVHPMKFVLGKSTMQDACWNGAPEYEYDRSSKHQQFQTTQYFGYDGNYLNYIFGVIGAPHIVEPEVEWSFPEEGELGEVVSHPSAIVPNMVCVTSGDPSTFTFDFWAFH